MSWKHWLKLGKPKSKPITGAAAPPSWLADKWNKTKRIGGATMTLGTGAALGSMIPFSASKSTEKDIDRMNSYQPDR